MNLFRSEEDARRWAEFVPGTEAGIVTLEQAMAIMSTPRQRERFTGHYVLSSPSYTAAFFAKLREVTGGSPYWEPPVT